MPEQTASPGAQDFLLFEGGPFSRLLTPLGKVRLEPRSVARTVAVGVLITWAPMATLAALQGVALGPSRAQSFLLDAAMYARYWVALPMLLLTADACGPRLQRLVRYVEDAQIVKEADREQFAGNVARAMETCNSGVAELVLLLMAFAHAVYVIKVIFPALGASWRFVDPQGQTALSWPCWWMVAVSQPVFSFLVLRLGFRILVWWKFLWATSRLELQLNASHPDGAGGLSFLGMSLPWFAFPAFALTAPLAGGLANIVLGPGLTVGEYRYTLLAFIMLIVVLFAGPLFFFYPQLKRTKLRGKLDYGWLSRRQLRRFEEKWTADPSANRVEGLLSEQDFSAVIDLSSTVQNVHHMRVIPFKYAEVLPVIVSALAPFIPVVALEIPVKEIVQALMKLAAS